MRTGTLVGALVVLGGYTLTLWGWCQLQGPGVGFADLILPSRLCGFGAKVAAARAATAGNNGVAPGSHTNPNGTIEPNVPPPSNLNIDPNTGRIGATPGTASPGPTAGGGLGQLPIFGGGGILRG